MLDKYKRWLCLRANRFQKPVIHLVISAAFVTVITVAFCVAYVYFYGIMTDLINPAEDGPIAKLLILFIAMLLPIIFIIIIVATYKITSELVGAFERLLRELDVIIESREKKHLKVRENDELANEIVKRINTLIDRLP